MTTTMMMKRVILINQLKNIEIALKSGIDKTFFIHVKEEKRKKILIIEEDHHLLVHLPLLWAKLPKEAVGPLNSLHCCLQHLL